MGIGTLAFCSVLTCAEIYFILHSLDKHWLQATLGYKVYLDIIFSLGTTIYFALSGTISGVIMAAISGAVFSSSLILMQKVIGYRNLVKIHGEYVWVQYNPTITVKSVKDKLVEYKDKGMQYLESQGVMVTA